MRAKFYVYVLTKPWDGVVCYVGKGRGKRYRDHAVAGARHYNSHLARIFKKAERLDATIEAEIVRDGLTEDEAFQTEIALIAALGRKSRGEGPLANLTDGGNGGSGASWSADSRKKLSATATFLAANPEEKVRRSIRLKVHWAKPEYQAKCSAAMKAANQRPDVKARKSASRKALWLDPQYRRNTAAAVSEGMKARWADPEYRAKQLAKIDAGRKVTPGFRANCSGATKATWSNPATRSRRTAGLQSSWDKLNPEDRARRLAGIRAANAARKKAARGRWEGVAHVDAR